MFTWQSVQHNTTHARLAGRVILNVNPLSIDIEFEIGCVDELDTFYSKGLAHVSVQQYIDTEMGELPQSNPLMAEALLSTDLSYDSLEAFLQKVLQQEEGK